MQSSHFANQQRVVIVKYRRPLPPSNLLFRSPFPFPTHYPSTSDKLAAGLCRKSTSYLPPHADNTSIGELGDLRADRRVLHVLLQRRRVVLRLLEDAVHDRVGHDLHNLQKEIISIVIFAGRGSILPRGPSEFSPSSAAPSLHPSSHTWPAAPSAAADQSPSYSRPQHQPP